MEAGEIVYDVYDEDIKYVCDGSVRKEDGIVVVEAKGDPSCVDYGAVCINPDAPEKDRVYRKVFKNKQIFLFDDYTKVVSILRSNPASFVLSMNGYSSLKKDWLTKYGIKEKDYEYACIAILKSIIDRLRLEFPGIRLYLTSGASDMGVDWSIEQVTHDPKYNLNLLGFSCPRYMLYVKDDPRDPVFVAPNSDAYADYYIKSLDFLVATGGRDQALKHDVIAACLAQVRIHFVDVLSRLSDNNVPAVIIDEKGKKKIENAPAAFGKNISFTNERQIVINNPKRLGKWGGVFDDIAENAIEVCRPIMPPENKFK